MANWLKIKSEHEHQENERKRIEAERKQAAEENNTELTENNTAPASPVNPNDFGYKYDNTVNIPSAEMPR